MNGDYMWLPPTPKTASASVTTSRAMSAKQPVTSSMPVRPQNSQCPSKHLNMHLHKRCTCIKVVMYAQLSPPRTPEEGASGNSAEASR